MQARGIALVTLGEGIDTSTAAGGSSPECSVRSPSSSAAGFRSASTPAWRAPRRRGSGSAAAVRPRHVGWMSVPGYFLHFRAWNDEGRGRSESLDSAPLDAAHPMSGQAPILEVPRRTLSLPLGASAIGLEIRVCQMNLDWPSIRH
jgi:hypothetical protein